MPKVVRILHVFGRMDRGGAETMIMNLYRNIDRSRVQFDFIVHTNEKCAYDVEITELGGKIFRVPKYVGKNHFKYKKSWNDFFKTHQNYKIIHGHVRSTATIYLNMAKKYGLITISHSHSTSSGKGISAIAKNILQYPIRHIADYLFACSKSAGVWLYGSKSCNKRNFYVLNNAIDLKKFAFSDSARNSKRKEFNVEGKFILGHVGRFNSVKNHKFLINIFDRVYSNNKNAVLMLVGEGELRQSLEEKVNNLGLKDNVIFTGIRSDIHELLQIMDVFILPSFYEGFPVSLIEAQASGLPCIVSNIITKDVNISGLVKFLSLDDSIELWVDEIMKYKSGFSREDTTDKIKNASFDVKENAKWLEKFYLNLST